MARNGQTVMSAVEIYGFGGQDTMEAAINFKNAKILPSSVTNCAIHNSLGWGARILHSGGDVTKRATGLAAGEAGGIVFSNNFIFNVRPHGLVVSYSKNGIVDGNIIMKVVGRGKDTDSYKDREGGIVLSPPLTMHYYLFPVDILYLDYSPTFSSNVGILGKVMFNVILQMSLNTPLYSISIRSIAHFCQNYNIVILIVYVK